MVEQTVQTFGRLDAIVNNASSFYPTPIGAITPEAWEDLIGTNLRAPLFLAQAAAAGAPEGAGRDRKHRRHPCGAPAQEFRRLLDREGRASSA
jgi:NAD(P)-dependent dehydrogenase (short-subunit alcohol dehydrogenase family)